MMIYIRTTATFLVLLCLLALAQQQRHAAKVVQYNGLSVYLDKYVPVDEPIGVVLSECIYPLYGGDLSRKVVAVPATAERLDVWLRFLHDRRIRFVAVGPIFHRWNSTVLKWLNHSGNFFVPVVGKDVQNEIVLFRVTAN